jgi:hypothetical protein
MNDDIHHSYVAIYDKCRRARDKGKQYIDIQLLRVGGYRLVATNNPGRESCYFFDGFGLRDWAQNIMYRLSYLGFFKNDDLDEYFGALDSVGYGQI